jgi:hypothetical protein
MELPTHVTTLEPSVLFTSTISLSLSLGADHAMLSSHGLSIYNALRTNGLIIGVVCGRHVPSTTPPQDSLIPLSLHPTPLQSTAVHAQWFDQFPFPRLRDRFILLSATWTRFDEIFQADLFTTESLEVKTGGVSWEANDWRINSAFKKRWEFVFS